ncbi:MAG: polyhydroxyalkanoate depolymerase, partial [Gemmataceae bacterium]
MTAFTLICAIFVPSLLFSPETPAALPEAVVTAMQAAGDNRAELERAWKECPPQQRAGLAFLLTHMPDSDRKSLKADYLLENLSLGYRARENTPWGRSIPEEIFLNDVLPYANLDETREAWRKSLMEMCLPMVKECKTAREAAQKLNSTLFGKVKVRYSTARKKAN